MYCHELAWLSSLQSDLARKVVISSDSLKHRVHRDTASSYTDQTKPNSSRPDWCSTVGAHHSHAISYWNWPTLALFLPDHCVYRKHSTLQGILPIRRVGLPIPWVLACYQTPPVRDLCLRIVHEKVRDSFIPYVLCFLGSFGQKKAPTEHSNAPANSPNHPFRRQHTETK